MIKSQLIKKEKEFGFVGEVELVANVEDSELQMAQYQLELVSIYESLAKRFQLNDTIAIITDSVQMFLEAHKPS
jgi:regulator of sigma D